MVFGVTSSPFLLGATIKSHVTKYIVAQISVVSTGTPRRIDVDSTWILRRYVEDQISTNFHVVSTYFFDVISLIEKSTSFSGTFFDVISMVKKSMLFPRTFFDVILIHVVSTYIFRCNFDSRKIHVVFTYFFRCNFFPLSTVFLLTFFDVILMVE